MDSDLDNIREVKLEKKVYRLRHRDGKSWNEVAVKINKEFDKKFNSRRIQEIYDKYIYRSHVIKNTKQNAGREATRVNKAWMGEMKELLDIIKSKALKHLEIADKLLIEQYKEGNTNAYFKNLPVAISLFRSLLDQANSLGIRLEKIEINQKNFILNETQILQLVNQKMSQREKEQGYEVHPGTGLLVSIDKKKKKITFEE